jgi:5'-methylthioadenosine phosphorylase
VAEVSCASPGDDFKCEIGVIGGTGVYSLPGLEGAKEIKMTTPFGEPSLLIVGKYKGANIAFIARHGAGHRFLPTEVPYKANIFALKALGVKYLMTVSACGSLELKRKPGDLTVVDQYIDRTQHRDATFFGKGIIGHVDFGDPTSKKLNALVTYAIKKSLPAVEVHEGGTYVCMEGPAFSTRAESNMYRQYGGHVIGMTSVTEAKLAREADMAFTNVGMVTDYDCWHTDHGSVTVTEVMATLKSNGDNAQVFIAAAVELLLLDKFEDSAHTCGAAAVMTPASAVPNERRIELKPLFGKYLPPNA